MIVVSRWMALMLIDDHWCGLLGTLATSFTTLENNKSNSFFCFIYWLSFSEFYHARFLLIFAGRLAGCLLGWLYDIEASLIQGLIPCIPCHESRIQSSIRVVFEWSLCHLPSWWLWECGEIKRSGTGCVIDSWLIDWLIIKRWISSPSGMSRGGMACLGLW